jgi:hypothetical protein
MNYAVWIMGSHLNLDIFNIQNPDHHVLDLFVAIRSVL